MMLKAIAIIALALGLEAGFLLTAAVPQRPHAAARVELVKAEKPATPQPAAARVQARVVPPGRS